MVRVLVEATHNPPLTEEFLQFEIKVPNPCLVARNVRWLRSFVSRDRRRTICELEATDADTVREAYRQAGYSVERVWVANIVESDAESF
ncbi:MAG TPA: DUF4242 domain-containing protein [Cyanobacteria bacterium UBA8803]|nr:DUF4242 domain-containing protein [Cyanobacteria bacterium UBA9273]HBL61656.1 DUF4242 domain-containing protein [Cyanobacteria bacterium UBA8803]